LAIRLLERKEEKKVLIWLVFLNYIYLLGNIYAAVIIRHTTVFRSSDHNQWLRLIFNVWFRLSDLKSIVIMHCCMEYVISYSRQSESYFYKAIWDWIWKHHLYYVCFLNCSWHQTNWESRDRTKTEILVPPLNWTTFCPLHKLSKIPK
jgi:hypothetical protein